MTYNEFINNILNTRGRFACGNEYHETHHIIPKCMDGSNNDDNLIDFSQWASTPMFNFDQDSLNFVSSKIGG